MIKTRKNQRFLVSRKFVKFSRKSQAALEFLTTYAWAFLVIIIMVGALAYFGVLSPSKLLPDRCNFGSEITCNKDLMVVKNLKKPVPTDESNEQLVKFIKGEAITATDVGEVLSMRLENNFGSQVEVTKVALNTDITSLSACEVFFHKTGNKVFPDEDYLNNNGSVNDNAGTSATIVPDSPSVNDIFTWSSDETITLGAICAGGENLIEKEKIKFNMEIDYYPSSAGPSYTKKIFGEVFTTVQKI